MPEVGGQPMPPRAKRDEAWRQKVWIEIIEQGAPMEARMKAVDLVARAAAEAIALVGRNHAAVLLDQASESAAEPGRGGRPRGSGTHKVHEIAALTQAVLELSDGSPSGMRKAISTVVSRKPLHQRAGLRILLTREMQRLHPRITDKTRT
jgi:hypothetical protein